MTEQTTETEAPEVTPEINVNEGAASLGDAFSGTPETPATPPDTSGNGDAPPPQEKVAGGRGLESVDVWSDGRQSDSPKEDSPVATPEKTPESTLSPGEIQPGEKLFPGDQGQIDNWEKARARISSLEKELTEAKKTGSGADDLRKEFEAIDRIRNSEAYAAEVMAPQSEALAKAKEIADFAYIDQDTIEELFRAENSYQAEQQLKALSDEAAEAQLRPLIMGALEARDKGTKAIRASDPLDELKSWESRSRQLTEERTNSKIAEEIQLDSEALNRVFDEKIATTPVGQTKVAQQVRDSLAADIKNQVPVDGDTTYEAFFHGRMFPFYSQFMADQAREIAALKADLARIGHHPSTPPTPPVPSGEGVRPGGLPSGDLWNDGR